MKELLVRALSGFIYVALLLLSIYISKYTFIGFILLLGIICIAEFSKLVKIKPFLLLITFLLFIYLFHFIVLPCYILYALLAVILIINILLIYDLLRNKQSTSCFYFLYPIGGLLFVTLIPITHTGYVPHLITGVFLLIWINDIFAYLVGKSIGKTKLAPKISPNKTIEGFAGGFIASCIVSMLIYKYIPINNSIFVWWFWLLLAIIICIFGTLGDLIQSKFKRQAGVKDSGNLIPGHGGIFDRLDSIVFSASFVYLYLILFANVS